MAALNQEGRKCSARGEASRRTTTSHWRGKSDRGVVPMKLPNKAAGAIPAAAEVVEGRPRAQGEAEGVSLAPHFEAEIASFDAPHLRRPLTLVAVDRHYPRQEPYAVVPHVRICAGGGE